VCCREANNVHLPHMHYENSFCYPGTHDNETAVGWWQDSATPVDKAYLKAYLGSDGSDLAWDFIRAAMESVSKTSIFLMQVGGGCGSLVGGCVQEALWEVRGDQPRLHVNVPSRA
jgi:4-alpha-glucanotransferase